MGYSSTQKGYRLHSLTNKKTFMSRDVFLKEYMFPFKEASSTTKEPVVEQFVEDDDAFIIDPNLEGSEGDNVSEAASLASSGSLIASPEASEMQSSSLEEVLVPPTSVPPSLDMLEEGPRKSTRTSKPPTWLNGFVHGVPRLGPSAALGSSYPMSAYMSYASLSPHYFKALCNFSAVAESTSYVEALKDPKWIAAMD